MSFESGRLTVLHISDVHATDGELLYGSVNGLERLDRVGDYAIETGITPEAVLVTGDLVQRGHHGAYPQLKSALRRLEDRVGAPVHTVLGNHDSAEHAHILHGHEGGHYRTVHLEHLRLLLLDSSTGSLGEQQIEWLRGELKRPFRFGTVVALHHAPIGSPLPTLAKSGLRDADAMMQALVGSDAQIVLAGHFHHPQAATVNGIPISVGPSLAYHQVMNAGPFAVSGHDSAMFSLVHLTAQGVSTASVSLHSPPPLFTLPIAVPLHARTP